MKAYDAFGQELNEGDIITYPVRHSSVMHIRVALVDKIVSYCYERYGQKAEGVNLKATTISFHYKNNSWVLRPKKIKIWVMQRVVKINNDIESNHKEIKMLQEIRQRRIDDGELQIS